MSKNSEEIVKQIKATKKEANVTSGYGVVDSSYTSIPNHYDLFTAALEGVQNGQSKQTTEEVDFVSLNIMAARTNAGVAYGLVFENEEDDDFYATAYATRFIDNGKTVDILTSQISDNKQKVCAYVYDKEKNETTTLAKNEYGEETPEEYKAIIAHYDKLCADMKSLEPIE